MAGTIARLSQDLSRVGDTTMTGRPGTDEEQTTAAPQQQQQQLGDDRGPSAADIDESDGVGGDEIPPG